MEATDASPLRRAGDMVLEGAAMEQRGAFLKLAGIARMIDTAPLPADLHLPGCEQAARLGAEGTDPVPEFLTVELAALLGVHEGLAQALLTDVLNLRARHPLAWAALDQGRAQVWDARRVAQACADAELSLEAALWIDAKLAPCWGHLSWPRIRQRLRGLIRQADPGLAAARARQARTERCVRLTHLDDSTSLLTARMATPDALAVWQALDHLAAQTIADGAVQPLPVLRAQALADLARPADSQPGSHLPPLGSADLVVHVAAEDLPGLATAVEGLGVARVENRGDPVGPLLLPEVRELLGGRAVRVVPVIDMAGDPQVDSYEIPDRIRAQVRYRDVYSVFPFSSRRAGCCDLDHTVAYRHTDPPPGQTRPSNLAHLSRKEHRWKTWERGFTIVQNLPGTCTFTTPSGYRYLTHKGLTYRFAPRRE